VIALGSAACLDERFAIFAKIDLMLGRSLSNPLFQGDGGATVVEEDADFVDVYPSPPRGRALEFGASPTEIIKRARRTSCSTPEPEAPCRSKRTR
jgi:hypothetical protein